MKFSNKGGSLPYTLYFCQLLLFAFAAAWGVAWLLHEPPAVERKTALDRRQLFQNYRILKEFLNGGQEALPVATEGEKPPLLAAVENLEQAQELFAAKEYSSCLEILDKVPPRFQFLVGRREALRLKSLHAAGRYAEFATRFASGRPADLDTDILRLDILLKNGRPGPAFAEFKALFARQSLEAFVRHLSRPGLAALLKRLDEEYWFAKFSLLLENGDSGEFRRELPHSRFTELNRLFRAEFAYRGRSYSQARRLLRSAFSEKYRDRAAALSIKLDVRENPGLDVAERLERLSRRADIYPRLSLDLAHILTGKMEFAGALPFYERYFAANGVKDDEYWKTAWLLAWIHYRQGEKDQALKYFRIGSASPVPGYRIASRYWQAKIEGSAPPPMTGSPFSYYAVRAMGGSDHFRNLHQGFLLGIDERPGVRFLEIVEDLKMLVRHGRADDAAALIRWAKSEARLGAGDLNLLKLIESIIHYRQDRYFTAYSKFRGNFRFFEGVHLPHFLSGLSLPRPYEKLISACSREQGMDPDLTMALIREESFFRSDIRSPANACGLMQLLLGTARQVANGSGLKLTAADLYDPEINIRLGLAYLKSLLERYDGRLYLALAAYNAGPHRVDRWLQDFSLADEEEFIEMIPFSETRNYVKNILRNYFFYRYYSGSNPQNGNG